MYLALIQSSWKILKKFQSFAALQKKLGRQYPIVMPQAKPGTQGGTSDFVHEVIGVRVLSFVHSVYYVLSWAGTLLLLLFCSSLYSVFTCLCV